MIDKRIAYYTRKVAQAGDRKNRKFNKYRYERLLAYKKLLDKEIKLQRNKKDPLQRA